MVGNIVGGVNVFGGGLGLYNAGGNIGDLGLSSDTSCADHIIAWRVRNNPGLDFVPGGFGGDPARLDNIIYDFAANPTGETGISVGGFGHPECLNTGDQNFLPATQKAA